MTKKQSKIQASWSKRKAIKDLVYIKTVAINAMTEPDAEAEETEKILVDSKAASTAITSIKELNSICGINKPDAEAKAEKVVIKDDI